MKIVFVFVLFICTVCCRDLFEGDSCYKDGVEGTCLHVGNCRNAREDLKNNIRPQICSFGHNIDEPIICCVDTPSKPPVQEEECEPLDSDLSPQKTGQKAFDKCIEYQLKYVYPCDSGSDLLGEVGRQNRCHHKTDELIIGGSDADPYEFPHMALLGFGPLNDIEWLCGGSIISERFILTAGHCIAFRIDHPVTYVAIGLLSRGETSDRSKIYKVKRIIKHPQYQSPSKYNDIALLETETMKLDEFTMPACVHIGDVVNYSMVIATGWGLTHNNGKEFSDILQRVILTKFANKECSEKLKFPKRLMKNGFNSASQICYGDKEAAEWYPGGSMPENKDTCTGDSGGPIQIKDEQINCMYTIVGVTSSGKYCGFGAQPGLYTRVAHFLSWIEDTVWPN